MKFKLDPLLWGSIIAYLISGNIAFQTIKLTDSIEALLQVLAISILAIIVVTRFVFPKFQEKSPNIAYFLQFVPLSLFVYLLVFSTGSLASPFLILTHLFAIGMAFLVSPNVSMVYVFATALFLILNIPQDPTSQQLISENSFAVFLYMLAYGAILPFSQYIAKIYKQKEAWVDELSQMLVTSKQEEERLLKNIDHAVIVIDNNFKISYSNKAVLEKTGYTQSSIKNKKLFEAFHFKDSSGNNLTGDQLPIKAVITTKNEAKVDKIQISKKESGFVRINLKILPVIDHNSEVLGAMLILMDYSQSEEVQASNFDKVIQKIASTPPAKLISLSQDLTTMLKLESRAYAGLSQFVDLAPILENQMFLLESEAKKKNLALTCPSPTVDKTLPKGKVLMPQKKCSFPNIFVLANENLLKIAVFKLFKASVLLANNGTSVNVDLTNEEDKVRIELTFKNKNFSQESIGLLYNTFGSIQLAIAEAENLTGLEIPIAARILVIHNGNLKIEKTQEYLKIIANLLRPDLNTQAAAT